MRLITRFRLLIAIAALATLIGLGIAYWGVGAVVRQVSAPYGQITGVLTRLDTIKRDFEWQFQMMRDVVEEYERRQGQSDDSGQSTQDDEPRRANPDAMRNLNDEVRQQLEELTRNPAFARYAGTNVSNSIAARVFDLAQQLDHDRELLASRDPTLLVQTYRDTSNRFESLHRIIEELEGRMLDDMEMSLAYTDAARSQVNSVLVVCLVLAGLSIILVFLLQSRWFTQPLRQLRDATTELSAGNFEHRIPVASRDELGMVSLEINQMARTITQMQGQLIERERLAAIGEMLRRIVHNLRNPLAGIRSLAELTQSDLGPDSDLRENQQRIIRTVDRFEQWLAQMLQSTRPLDVSPEPTELAHFIKNALEPQRATAQGAGITMILDLDDAPRSANIDPVHFQHVLIALVANAIEVLQSIDGPRQVRITAQRQPSGWQLVVEDSGPGIDPQLHARVFEPYFTTKVHGSGIGLAIVRNIILAHGGTIAVDRSELGGARFEVSLGKV